MQPTETTPEKTGSSRTAFPPLSLETRTHISTAHCAFLLNRKPQTLRVWSLRSKGPLQPIRVHGRLAWPVSGIKQLLKLRQ
ncbi:MAG: hypothetical protein DCF26_14435 [Burkholderiales bacterium]|nr:MAG: hypothetical protein DCF26_14435 [Burkholderiales bacterium]